MMSHRLEIDMIVNLVGDRLEKCIIDNRLFQHLPGHRYHIMSVTTFIVCISKKYLSTFRGISTLYFYCKYFTRLINQLVDSRLNNFVFLIKIM